VMDEIREFSLNEYRGIREMIKRKYFVFYNDFFVDTFIDGDSLTKITKAQSYLSRHIPDIPFFILSKDNIADYPFKFTNTKDVQDLILKVVEKEKTAYEEYLKEDILEILYKQGKVYKGVLYTEPCVGSCVLRH
jgi:hypothetical protein